MNKLLFVASLLLPLTSFSLERLSAAYPWPVNKPSVKPNGWSMFVNQRQLKKALRLEMRLIVELGSWLGASTRFMLDHAPHATVIAIDHWRGSAEHQQKYDYMLPLLYQTFIVNCWEYRNRLIPMQTTTLNGLDEIYAAGLMPDLIYVDASHDFNSVMADLEKIFKLFPSARIVGDDWNWDNLPGAHFPVRAAVQEFVRKHGLRVQPDENFWMIVT